MNPSTKTWASLSGVCIATAVVIGASVAAATHTPAAPPERQVGNAVTSSPAPSTVTVTASPTATATVKASSSVVTKAAPKRAVVRQEAPVIDPTTTAQQQAPAPAPQPPAAAATTPDNSTPPPIPTSLPPGVANPCQPGRDGKTNSGVNCPPH